MRLIGYVILDNYNNPQQPMLGDSYRKRRKPITVYKSKAVIRGVFGLPEDSPSIKEVYIKDD